VRAPGRSPDARGNTVAKLEPRFAREAPYTVTRERALTRVRVEVPEPRPPMVIARPGPVERRAVERHARPAGPPLSLDGTAAVLARRPFLILGGGRPARPRRRRRRGGDEHERSSVRPDHRRPGKTPARADDPYDPVPRLLRQVRISSIRPPWYGCLRARPPDRGFGSSDPRGSDPPSARACESSGESSPEESHERRRQEGSRSMDAEVREKIHLESSSAPAPTSQRPHPPSVREHTTEVHREDAGDDRAVVHRGWGRIAKALRPVSSDVVLSTGPGR